MNFALPVNGVILPIPKTSSNTEFAEYTRKHARCPVCGGDNYLTTTAGIGIECGALCDKNRVWCEDCGWKGIGHELTPIPKTSSNTEYDEYTREHARCPVCGGDNYLTTTAGIGIDTNSRNTHHQ